MAREVFWMEGPWPGRLAIGLRPRGGDWLGADVEAWRAEGVQVVVSLLEPHELRELELEEEPEACRRLGLAFRAIPVPDRGLPPALEPVSVVVRRLAQDILAGRKVLVHCRQGIGRSALLASAVLIALGVTAAEALEQVERSRGRPVPDTAEQRAWILGFQEACEALGGAGVERGALRVTRPAGGAFPGG